LDKSVLIEGKSERWMEILGGESNSFGFFHCDCERSFRICSCF